jgi:uncharacterized protein (DUF2062 family)
MTMFNNLQRTIRYYYIRFKRLQGDPRSLAIGSAIGVLIGVSPTLPLHTIMIVSLTLLLRVSTLSALISATIVSNPLTFAPQYFLCWKVGDLLLPGKLTWERMQETLKILTHTGIKEGIETIGKLGLDATLVMLSGGLLIGIPLALITYFLSLRFFMKIQEKRQKRRLLKESQEKQ